VIVCLAACSKSTSATPQASTAAAPAAAAQPASPQPSAAAPSSAPQQPAVANASAAPGQSAPTPAAKPVPAQLPKVVAVVNGEEISATDLEKAVKNAEQQAGGPVPAEQRDQIYRGLLDRLVGEKLLIQESKARKVTVPDADVDAQIGQLRQRFPTEDAFKQALDQQHLTVADLKTSARQGMAVQKLLADAVNSKVSVKPEDVEAFYANERKANPKEFERPESVKASHILIQVPKGSDAATKAALKAKAEGILKQARAGGDFAELAKQNSQDPGSAPNGGDLGFFARGQMVGPFNDVAFSQKPGTISDLVETEFGFHIIKVIEKKPAGVVPLEEVRGQIEQYLQNKTRDQQTEAFVNGLRSKGKVQIYI
jgi:peptidyl-prolyl cis-trans isomerase C